MALKNINYIIILWSVSFPQSHSDVQQQSRELVSAKEGGIDTKPLPPIKQDSSEYLQLRLSNSKNEFWLQSNGFRLVMDLLDAKRYSQLVRPVRNDTMPVDVTMKFNLYQLLDVNEPSQNVVLYMWIMQLWKDEFLGWNPAEYSGINWTVLAYDKIWLPDTYLYNSLEMGRDATERWISAIITTKQIEGTDRFVGDIRFQYPALYTFSCKMNILYFPFDTQNCTMMFGSWVYDAAGIRYFTLYEKVQNESYVANEEWSVLSFEIIRHENMYSCCPNPYTELHLHLVIQRKPLYYLVNLVVPTAIIALIAIVGFFTPAASSGDRTEKINLGITTLLAMSILLLMVSDQMPTTSNFVPLIGWFFLSIILLISLGTFFTALIIIIQQRGRYGRPVPGWARQTCFNLLPTCLFMQPPESLVQSTEQKEETNKHNDSIWNGNRLSNDLTGEPLLRPAWVDKDGITRFEPNYNALHIPASPKRTSSYDPREQHQTQLRKEIRQMHDKIAQVQDYISSQQEDDTILLEWEYLAAVMDRFLLVVFSLAVVLVTAVFMIVGSLI